MKLNRFIASAAAFVVAFCTAVLFLPQSADIHAADEPEKIVLYGIDEEYQSLLEIPQSCPETYQITAGEAIVNCKVSSGNSVDVTKEGLISIRQQIMYWNGGIGSSWSTGAEGERKVVTNHYGSSVVTVTTESGSFDVNVEVLNYAEVYVNNYITDYLVTNVKDSMSIEDVLDKITALPASFDYSAKYSGYLPMVIYRCGDCWASTALILKECQMLGLDAWKRNGNRDPGAGSGHQNVLVEYEGSYYELEAGYNQKAPRHYTVTKRDSLFCFHQVSEGYEIYQYDGRADKGTVIDIPSEHNGKPVVGFSNYALSSNDFCEEYVLPETIKYISAFCFYNCKSLKKLNIPASVEVIRPGAFPLCPNLTEIVLDPANQNYVLENGGIYDSAKTTLLHAMPSAEFVIADTVTDIADYAFYGDQHLKNISMPDSVKNIGMAAFYGCSALEHVRFGSSTETIGDGAFSKTPLLTSVDIPESVNSIGKGAFTASRANASPQFTIYGAEGSAAQLYAEKAGIPFIEGKAPLFGDANCDGSVNLADAVLIMQAVSNPDRYKLSDQGTVNGDVTGNGDGITNKDALTIQQYKLNLIASLPVKA